MSSFAFPLDAVMAFIYNIASPINMQTVLYIKCLAVAYSQTVVYKTGTDGCYMN